MSSIFKNLFLLGRPASGKSEFIDFMKKVPEGVRAAKYHIGPFEEIDDFPWIWAKFKEDDVWEAAGYPRRYSFGGANPGMSKEGAPLLDFCMAKFNQEVAKHKTLNTLFIEFSRGGFDGYAKAFSKLDPSIFKKAAILFIHVSYEESCRRNESRYQEKLQHSILAHKVPESTMQTFYQTHDWLHLTQDKPDGFLTLGGREVPFVTMNNTPELTDPVLLEKRYQPALARLMELTNAHV